ncbi:hypothetical protein [Pseudogracilibacillus sp. SO30301A]|uniref:hypothetical protein n=1 Tax=Pseudogracilibacillus sp. SO30301A TaxID=3098291 RepID=UPI00300E3520
MRNIQKPMFLFGISCLLMGLLVAPFTFFFIRALDPVEIATFQAGEEFQVAGRASYTTYRTSDETTSCQEQDGKDIELFQERDPDIAFTSDDFLLRVNVICNSEITAFEETSPTALRLTSGLFIASPVFIGAGIWFIRRNKKAKDSN